MVLLCTGRRCRQALAALLLASAGCAASAGPVAGHETLARPEALAARLTRAQALAATGMPDAGLRLAGVLRLGAVGQMVDADRLLNRLGDTEEPVRDAAAAALWRIWSRSGDAAIDKLLARGVGQMQADRLDQALATFDQIVRRKPAFAEGWNKRATVYFLLGRHAQSLRDCDEVLKRNPNHFGALSGAAQIHLHLGNAREALVYFRRALQINPGLDGAADLVPLLEQQLQTPDPGSI